MEIGHCERLTFNVEDSMLHTVQADLCDGVTLRYGQGLFQEGHKVYHAGTKDLNVIVDGGRLTAHADYIRDLAPVVIVGQEESPTDPRSEEQHFITQLVDNALVSERAERVGDRWVSQRQLDAETTTQASVTQREMEELKHQAERQKMCGNQSFQNGEYAQAAVHYTMAIDHANSAQDTGSAAGYVEPNPLIHVCYANRAACFLKLGQHDKALQDSDSCIEEVPEFVKGHFRRGLALHAMQRFREALPSLGKALELENPKNKASVRQIKEAITFAEAKLAKQLRG